MPRVLFIGNSFTSRNDLPGLLAELAAAADGRFELATRMVVAGGASLRRHWNAGIALHAIESERWDWVVLQEQSTLPLKNPQRYHDNVRLFDEAIRQHGSRTALYLTWSRQHARQTQRAITDAVQSIATERNACAVPVGVAWHEALQRRPPAALYSDDGSHPTAAGSYLAACTFLAALFGCRARGSALRERLGLDADTAAMLEDAAWHAATERGYAHDVQPPLP